MKILLIGPVPPPHGGISVHVSEIYRQLTAAGVPCRVLNTDRVGPAFVLTLLVNVFAGWTLHVHTNGHNRNSWLLALICGVASRLPKRLPKQLTGGCILTLHSGMAPAYLAAYPRRRKLARVAVTRYRRVICVSDAIRNAVLPLGLPPGQIEIVPACLKTEGSEVSLDAPTLEWLERHQPLLSTVLFFRPEYGFDLLVSGLAEFRRRHPSVGCIVMGSGEQRAQAEARIREAGLEDNILVLGDVDHDTCLAVMARTDVFVRPTLEDGDSISVREALALGIPVVASRVGTRPAGAILFQPGNVDEMLSRVELALAVKRAYEAPPASGIDRLMEAYAAI